jgi:hypothetical protein
MTYDIELNKKLGFFHQYFYVFSLIYFIAKNFSLSFGKISVDIYRSISDNCEKKPNYYALQILAKLAKLLMELDFFLMVIGKTLLKVVRKYKYGIWYKCIYKLFMCGLTSVKLNNKKVTL